MESTSNSLIANSLKISVIISTYNPNLDRLNQTLIGLKNQNLTCKEWELIIIDNNSSTQFEHDLEIDWHSNYQILKEPKPGLTYGRMKGFESCKSELIIMVDDDNILEANYLSETLKIFNQYPNIGAIGGKSIPKFESKPPFWIKNYYNCLALRDLGNKIILEKWKEEYPAAAPIGAGMAIRKVALTNYIKKVKTGKSKITDRKGTNLSSGGDNDIVLEILKSGWEIAYFPILSLKHIIPANRMKAKYLGQLNKDSTKSWVHLLNSHGINPWRKIPKLTLNFRKIKAWFIYKPWKNESNHINFKGICGMYEALAEL